MATKTKKPAAKRIAKAAKRGKAKKTTAAKANPTKHKAKAKAAQDGAPKAGTKLALLTEMVSGKGATTAELCEALGWQPHTLRAAISRLPIKPVHSRIDGVTSYRIGG
jgi:hypothetical protein